MKLYDSDEKRHAIPIIDPPYAKLLEMNEIQKALKDIFACFRFICKTSDGSLKNGF